jgi:transcriptional regulator with XRE-family HTH domain
MYMIGKAIFDTVAEQKITFTEFATRIGLTQAAVLNYRGERSLPSAKSLMRMMREFPTLAARLGFRAINDVDSAAEGDQAA